jgi:hypothetical protein
MLIIGAFTEEEVKKIKKTNCKIVRELSNTEVARLREPSICSALKTTTTNLLIDVGYNPYDVIMTWDREKHARTELERNMKLDQERRKAADEAFENYDFHEHDIPEESDIEDHEGWECDGTGMFTKLFYYTNPIATEDSIKGTFRVLFETGSPKIKAVEVNTH